MQLGFSEWYDPVPAAAFRTPYVVGRRGETDRPAFYAFDFYHKAHLLFSLHYKHIT